MDFEKNENIRYDIVINRGLDYVLNLRFNEDVNDFPDYQFWGIIVSVTTGEKISFRVDRDNELQKLKFKLLSDYTKELKSNDRYIYQIIEQKPDGEKSLALWGYARIYDTVLI